MGALRIVGQAVMDAILLTVVLVIAALAAWGALRGLGARRANRVEEAAAKAVRRRMETDNDD